MKIDMLIFSIFAIVALIGVVIALAITTYKDNEEKRRKKKKEKLIRKLKNDEFDNPLDLTITEISIMNEIFSEMKKENKEIVSDYVSCTTMYIPQLIEKYQNKSSEKKAIIVKFVSNWYLNIVRGGRPIIKMLEKKYIFDKMCQDDSINIICNIGTDSEVLNVLELLFSEKEDKNEIAKIAKADKNQRREMIRKLKR